MPCRQLTLGGELIAHTQLTQAQAPLKGLQNDAVAAVRQNRLALNHRGRLCRLGVVKRTRHTLS